jgi:hypothetical protein
METFIPFLALLSITAATPLAMPLEVISERTYKSCPEGGTLPPRYLSPTLMVPLSAKFPDFPFGSTKTPHHTQRFLHYLQPRDSPFGRRQNLHPRIPLPFSHPNSSSLSVHRRRTFHVHGLRLWERRHGEGDVQSSAPTRTESAESASCVESWTCVYY